MSELNVFVSVGGSLSDQQDAFVRAIEVRLASEGLIPKTVGRNTFSSDAPLKTVTEVMDNCAGTLVIVLERFYFPSGTERRGGPNEALLDEVKLPTPWNQIEAAMAYSRGLPLMVIVEHGIRSEGLLERGYDWYVQWVKPDAGSLNTPEFNGVLASWRQKVTAHASRKPSTAKVKPDELTVGDILKGMRPSHLWSLLGAIAVLVGGSFALGVKLAGG